MEKRKILSVVADLGRGGVQRAAQNYSLIFKDIGLESKMLTLKEGIRKDYLDQNNIEIFTPDQLDNISQWAPDVVFVNDHGVPDQIIINLREQLPTIPFLEINTFSLPSTRRSAIDIQTHMSQWCLWKYQTEVKVRNLDPGLLNVVIPYSVNTEKFYNATKENVNDFRKELNIPEDAIILGRIGQKIKSKWSEVILSTFDKICQETPNCYLVLVGVPPFFETKIKKKYGHLADKIRILDYVDTDHELRVVYSTIDIFVHAAWLGESFGMVLTESMLCETPVVSLSTPYNDNSQIEVISHGTGGLIAKTEKEFAEQIRILIKNPDYRIELGKKAREHVISNFSPKKIGYLFDRLISIVTSKDKKHWKVEIEREFSTQIDHKSILQLIPFNNSNYLMRWFISNRILVGRLLPMRFAWNFLFRNYLKLFHIKNL